MNDWKDKRENGERKENVWMWCDHYDLCLHGKVFDEYIFTLLSYHVEIVEWLNDWKEKKERWAELQDFNVIRSLRPITIKENF